MRTCSFLAIRISRISLTLCRYPACHILPPWIQLSRGFELKLQNFTLAVLPFRRIKKINLTSKLQLQTLHWYFGFTEISPFPPSKRCFRNTKRIYSSPKVHFRSTEGQTFYWSIYDSWWQHQTSVCALGHDSPSGRFSKSCCFSASVSSPFFPTPPRSFTRTIFGTVFDSRSSFFARKPHGNACYTGCKKWYVFQWTSSFNQSANSYQLSQVFILFLNLWNDRRYIGALLLSMSKNKPFNMQTRSSKSSKILATRKETRDKSPWSASGW